MWNQDKKPGSREHFAGGETRKDKVERAFGKMDKMARISSSLRSCVGFLKQNNILADRPDCDKCGEKMDNCNGRATGVESRGYSCKSCFTRKSVRYGSFL